MDIKKWSEQTKNSMANYFSYCQDNIKGIMPYVIFSLWRKMLKIVAFFG